MSTIRIRPYSEYTDFALANAYYNRLQYETQDTEELNDFWKEVDKRRGDMLPSEWLDYHY